MKPGGKEIKFRNIKNELRIIGWDDAPFGPGDRTVAVFGVIFRGGLWMDGLLRTDVAVDGDDATEKLAAALKKTRHLDQLRAVMLKGITMAGFNTVDIVKLSADTGLPVIVVSRKTPDFARIREALAHLPDGEKRWSLIKKAGKPMPCKLKGGVVYYQKTDIGDDDARAVIGLSATRSLIPEPLRIAHIIAAGVTRGESYGRA